MTEKLKNEICLESGIIYELTVTDVEVIRKALSAAEVKPEEAVSLSKLKTLFFDYLD